MTQNGMTNEFLLNLLFYIIITPVIGLMLTKIMHMSEDGQIVEQGKRGDLIGKDGLFARIWRNYQTSAQWKVAKEG